MSQINIPKTKTTFGTISKQSPGCCIRMDSFNQAVDFAMGDQPAYRPWYIVKCTETYGICATIEEDGRVVKVNDNAQSIGSIPRKAIEDAIAEIKFYRDKLCGDSIAEQHEKQGIDRALMILNKCIAEVEE